MPEDLRLLQTFLEQSPVSRFIVDRDFVCRSAHGETASILGVSVAQLQDCPIAHVLDPDVVKVWMPRFERAFEGESLSLRERRGAVSWQIQVFPLRIDGEVRYAAAVGTDATAWGRADQELRNTVLGALKAQEFERNTVSRFLHDSVGQNMTALGLQLDLIRMDLEPLSPEICRRIAEIQKLLESMMEQVREYSFELNPSTVERAGLRTALDRLAARFQGRFTGAVRLNVDPSLKLDRRIASAMYYIAQEAIENAAQHSSCSAVEIAVKSSRNGTFLEVRDNGRGFDPADLSGGGRGLGLLTMEHYAAQAGLDLSITSTREGGTAVRATATGAS
jgi:signal transduction histidine kinase